MNSQERVFHLVKVQDEWFILLILWEKVIFLCTMSTWLFRFPTLQRGLPVRCHLLPLKTLLLCPLCRCENKTKQKTHSDVDLVSTLKIQIMLTLLFISVAFWPLRTPNFLTILLIYLKQCIFIFVHVFFICVYYMYKYLYIFMHVV